MTRRPWAALLVGVAAALPGTMALAAEAPAKSGPAAAPAKDTDLMSLDLDALANTKVTSVSKREERLADAPAAISVLTGEDIQRSGAKSIPEALRLVPGMQVAQASASLWNISARGFQGQFSDKLLVLVDGRTVYTPTFSGVDWDAQDMVLEDIDRIEVIRGPGATVWGANAVNGVVNIVTKSAKDTQGALVTVSSGTDRNASTAIRYGGALNKELFMRVYGKYDANDNLVLPNGDTANDRWDITRGGFRMDWLPSDVTVGTFQGDIFQGQEHPNATVRGANVLGRWTRTFSPSSSVSLQSYFDHIDRTGGTGTEARDTVDLDFQHNVGWGERQSLVYGLNYRFSRDDLSQVPGVVFLPAKFDQNLFGAFVQDTITLVEKRLDLTVGTKLEHNDFTGVEVQPSARLAWKPTERHTVWGAVSRAVRTPNRYDTAVAFNFVPGAPPVLMGNPNFRSETLMAYELGYRLQAAKNLSFDLSGYYHDYDEIKGVDFGTFSTQNSVQGRTYGADLSASYQPFAYWRLTPFFSFITSDFTLPAGNYAVIPLDQPKHQAGLRSAVDFAKNWQFDVTGRFVDEWKSQNVPSYVTFDVRLAWQATKNLQLAVVGQNLAEKRHIEAGAGGGAAFPVEAVSRSVYGKLTLKF